MAFRQPRPPMSTPPASATAAAAARRAGYGQAPAPPLRSPPGKGKGGGKGGVQRPTAVVGPRRAPPSAPAEAAYRAMAKSGPEAAGEAPSWMGAASRKRKWELAAERGLVPRLGYSSGDPYGAAPRGAVYASAQPSRVVGGGVVGGKGRQEDAKRQRGQAGKGGGKGAAAAVQFISLPADAPFVVGGLPEVGPIVQHSSEGSVQNVLWATGSIMEAIGITEEAIVFTDDADWSLHPEIGEAVKQATGNEVSTTIAECAEAGVWAVGCGGKKKQRENAARLALCVALAANMEDMTELATTQPEFVVMCEAAGVATGVDVRKLAQRQQQQQKPAKGGGKGGGKHDGGKPATHRDTPLWVNIAAGEEAIPEVLEALPPETVAMSSDGGRRPLYSKVDAALKYFVGEDIGETVEYFDDPQRKDFPAVASAVKAVTHRDEGVTVAVCSTPPTWAVGVGNKARARKDAARAALAGALALQHLELGQEIDYTEFPVLEKFVQEAQAARDAAAQ